MRAVFVSLLRVAFAAVACAPLLRATLTWEATTLEQSADFGQEEITVSFAFRNNGTSPVTVTSVEASCGCTATSLARRTYAPGESGTLGLTYRPDGETGLQTKTVTVATDAPAASPTTLTLKVNLPRLVDISPRLVTWAKGSEPTEKVVDIVLHRTPGTRVTLATAPHENLEALLEPGSGPGRHLLRLRPASTNAAFRAVIRLRVESDGLAPQVLAVYADLR